MHPNQRSSSNFYPSDNQPQHSHHPRPSQHSNPQTLSSPHSSPHPGPSITQYNHQQRNPPTNLPHPTVSPPSPNFPPSHSSHHPQHPPSQPRQPSATSLRSFETVPGTHNSHIVHNSPPPSHNPSSTTLNPPPTHSLQSQHNSGRSSQSQFSSPQQSSSYLRSSNPPHPYYLYSPGSIQTADLHLQNREQPSSTSANSSLSHLMAISASASQLPPNPHQLPQKHNHNYHTQYHPSNQPSTHQQQRESNTTTLEAHFHNFDINRHEGLSGPPYSNHQNTTQHQQHHNVPPHANGPTITHTQHHNTQPPLSHQPGVSARNNNYTGQTGHQNTNPNQHHQQRVPSSASSSSSAYSISQNPTGSHFNTTHQYTSNPHHPTHHPTQHPTQHPTHSTHATPFKPPHEQLPTSQYPNNDNSRASATSSTSYPHNPSNPHPSTMHSNPQSTFTPASTTTTTPSTTQSTLPEFEGSVSYAGELKNARFHGKGRLTYLETGVIFIGSFFEGKRHGPGCVYYPTTPQSPPDQTNNSIPLQSESIKYTKLEAMFENDRIKGVPTISFADGDVYIGPIRGGKFEGQGRYYYKETNDLYIGGFHAGLRTGFGVLKFNIRGSPSMIGSGVSAELMALTGMTEQIESWEHLKHTYAMKYHQGSASPQTGPKSLSLESIPSSPPHLTAPQIAPTSTLLPDCAEVYIGTFSQDVFSGEGKFLGQNGIYIGHWDHGVKHGLGTLYYPNGNFFCGNFDSDKKSGKGLLQYSKGGCFDGNWANDVAHDNGVCWYSSGEIFFGNFIDGRKNGPGKLKMPNGDVIEATWGGGDDDRIQSEFTSVIRYVNGCVFEGRLVNDQRDGYGTLTDPSKQQRFEGYWRANRRHGAGKIILNDGSVVQGEWRDGQIVGDLIFTFHSSSIWLDPDV